MAVNVRTLNRVKQATATTGTGTVTLGSASTGYFTASEAGVVNGDILTYVIEEGNDFEIGYGTYSTTGPTLTRDNVEASKISGTAGTSKMNLAGAATVSLVPIAKGLARPMGAGGRLTLATGTPVMTSSQSAKTTVYYTPYVNQLVPLWDGFGFYLDDMGAELSQATTDSTKSPAAVTTNSNYDVFYWNDSGTRRATRGPAWSSDTARGTGAGTSELELFNGIYVNKNAVTNGPAARKGTYLGTIRSDGSSQINFTFGSSASGGGAGVLGVWNMYNRVLVTSTTIDSTTSWPYTSGNWRGANNSSTMRCSLVLGLVEEPVSADFRTNNSTSSNGGQVSVGLDSTTAIASGASTGWNGASGATTAMSALYFGYPGLGFHYLQAIEYGGAGMTFYGTTGFPNGAYMVTARM